jgi:hypothetical protein
VRAFLALLLIAGAAACDKGGDEPRAGEAARPAEAPAPGAPPLAQQARKPLEGPLTVERLVAAKAGVRPYEAWDEAWAHLVATAGEPTSSAGDVFTWTLAVGETCHVLEVRRADDRVDAVLYAPYQKGTPQHERCAAPGK